MERQTETDQVDKFTRPGEWAFDQEVTNAFDDMLARSIPQYETMRGLVARLAEEYVRPGTHVVDLGCSRGEAMAPLVGRFRREAKFVGVEVSEPMRKAAEARFWGEITDGFVRILDLDLRTAYPDVAASVTLAVLTIQFVPIEYRQQIVDHVFRTTLPGGAFILIEKVLGYGGEIDTLMVKTYLEMKRAHGYSEEQIQRKKLALEGKLVPVTAAWNEDLLSKAGFRQVDCFWRWLNFAGWIAVRGA